MEEFWSAAKTFGFNVAALVAVVLAVWLFGVKSLWPYMKDQIAASQKRLDDTTAAFLHELREQREDNEKRMALVAANDERRVNLMMAVFEASFRRVHDRFDDLGRK